MSSLPLIDSQAATISRFRVAVYEGTGAAPLDPAVRRELVSTLLAKGFAVTVVRPGATVSGPKTGTLVVLGRFDEAKPDKAADGDVTVHFRDVSELSTAQVLEVIDGLRGEESLKKPGAWKPWFPVIDYDRCTNCMQCLSFCLFDVYGVSQDKKIQVQNQNKCKTDCPACSRVCPEVAILFPKYRHGPINGDVVNSEDMRREVMKVDISALLGGDIYQALRDRSAKSKSRFAKERDEDRALEERQKCLVALGKSLEIPAEVFASLPSIDQIKAKAEEASAKAAAALADQPSRTTQS
jgi:NAD-dependent dihydropyrimidine dehydrogenase PreA subunit